MALTCRRCHEGDSPTKGKVLIYPAGNFHEECRAVFYKEIR
jgi:hypothetical protein